MGRMKTIREMLRLAAAALAGCAAIAGAAGEGTAGEEAAAAAEEELREVSEEELLAEVGNRRAAEALMERLRAGVPSVPLTMDAEVQVLDRYGKRTGRWTAAAELKPERDGSGKRLYYLIGGGQGVENGEMEVFLPEGGGAARYAWRAEDGESAMPDLTAPLGGADISWTELGFSFFWWENPRIVGVERLKHRWNCQVVELDEPGGGDGVLRLWVAPSWGAVVQGELLRDGKAVKRFEVESVTKIRKVYMLSEMTVRNLETGGRSRLKISNLAMKAPDYTDEEWERFTEPVKW